MRDYKCHKSLWDFLDKYTNNGFLGINISVFIINNVYNSNSKKNTEIKLVWSKYNICRIFMKYFKK